MRNRLPKRFEFRIPEQLMLDRLQKGDVGVFEDELIFRDSGYVVSEVARVRGGYLVGINVDALIDIDDDYYVQIEDRLESKIHFLSLFVKDSKIYNPIIVTDDEEGLSDVEVLLYLIDAENTQKVKKPKFDFEIIDPDEQKAVRAFFRGERRFVMLDNDLDMTYESTDGNPIDYVSGFIRIGKREYALYFGFMIVEIIR